MEKEIIETYAFNPEDYYDGRRKSDGKINPEKRKAILEKNEM